MRARINTGPLFAFTILTPTYNRAHLLSRVYDSLRAQTFRDFEWIIVDDGSTDGTRELVAAWASEANFPIRYFWQAHRHKKTAFNRGVREASGELFLCWDSDDSAPPDALEIFWRHWNAIPENERQQFVGVTGLCVDEDKKIIGDRFPDHPFDSDDLSMRFRYGVRGEKWGVHRVDLLRLYPYPESVEGFVPESVVWNALARRYKTRFVNEVVRVYHREEDSLCNATKTRKKLRSIAHGTVYAASEFLDRDIKWIFWSPWEVFKIAANFVRFSLHLRNSKYKATCKLTSTAGKTLVAVAWPVGLLAYAHDELSLPEE